MTNPEQEPICLPDELLEKQICMDQILYAAREIQDELNAEEDTVESRGIKGQKAMTVLDQMAEEVYMGEKVQIVGSYVLLAYTQSKQKISLEPVKEIGIRQGASRGFVVQSFHPEGEDGKPDESLLHSEICHLIAIPLPSIETDYLFIPAGAIGKLIAPIDRNNIGLSVIEAYKQTESARREVTASSSDKHWTAGIDRLLCSPQGPNLKSLGNMLERMSKYRPDRVTDYLSYINSKLMNVNGIAEVITDKFAYNEPLKKPIWINREQRLTGYNDGIFFIDLECKYKDATADTPVYGEGIPVLNLRGKFTGERKERIFYAPLDSIQSANFK